MPAGRRTVPWGISFSCGCPDHASMCKHVAAALHGVGAQLDQKFELPFRPRGVNGADLITGIDAAFSPLSRKPVFGGKAVEGEIFSALFGLDMAEPAAVAFAGGEGDEGLRARLRGRKL